MLVQLLLVALEIELELLSPATALMLQHRMQLLTGVKEATCSILLYMKILGYALI